MNSIKDITDEKVRRLAETLKQSGLAASETEAIRMALSMTNTTAKVNQVFDERKDRNIMGLSYLNKGHTLSQATEEPKRQEHTPHNQAQSVHQQGPVQQIQKVEIQAEDDCNCESCNDCGPNCDCSKYEEDQDSVIEQELVNEPAPKQEEKPKVQEQPKQATPERAPPKKDISQMEESKVDLSKVFGFRK